MAKSTIHRLLSRRDIPLRERTLWRMLYETAASAAQILPLNVEDLDLEGRKAPIRAKGGAVQWMYWDTGTAHLLPLRLPDAVIAWLDAGQPEPDQAASRIGQAIHGAITAAQPATAQDPVELLHRHLAARPSFAHALAELTPGLDSFYRRRGSPSWTPARL